MKYIEDIGNTVQSIYLTFGIAGVLLIALGAFIFIYPPALIVVATVGLVTFGVVLLVVAYKVYMLWRKLPNFMK